MISQNIHDCTPRITDRLLSQVFIHYLAVRIFDQGLTFDGILSIFKEATGLAPALKQQVEAKILALLICTVSVVAPVLALAALN